MISKRPQRHYSFLEPLKLTDKSTSGTLSPDTITTTSSGYSTGGSSVSTTIVPSMNDHNPQKIKSKSKQMRKRNYLCLTYFDVYKRHLLFLSSSEDNKHPLFHFLTTRNKKKGNMQLMY
jgi:hypothetical protein